MGSPAILYNAAPAIHVNTNGRLSSSELVAQGFVPCGLHFIRTIDNALLTGPQRTLENGKVERNNSEGRTKMGARKRKMAVRLTNFALYLRLRKDFCPTRLLETIKSVCTQHLAVPGAPSLKATEGEGRRKLYRENRSTDCLHKDSFIDRIKCCFLRP